MTNTLTAHTLADFGVAQAMDPDLEDTRLEDVLYEVDRQAGRRRTEGRVCGRETRRAYDLRNVSPEVTVMLDLTEANERA